MTTYLEVALEAVKAAEKIILGYYEGEIQVEHKADDSPVTAADKEAEAKIRDIITSAFPDHIVYGEEGAKERGAVDGYTWVVDPIDGTKSFIRHHGLFGTLLALYHNNEIILGVSNMPAIGECMYAEKGSGAYLNGSKIAVSEVKELSDAYMSYGSVKYFTQKGYQDALFAVSEHMRWARGIGDCWSYHLLAQGKVDIVIEAKTKIWDVAALKVIVEEAGGKMTALDGSAIGFDMQDDLATNGHLHQAVLDAFAK